VIDDRTMADFRMAATLVHALPGIVLQVDGSRTSYRVGHSLEPGVGVVPPCGFRVAVVQAHRHCEDGRPVAVSGFCPAERPGLTLSADEGHEIRPGGVCVVADEDGWRVVAATVLSREVCRDELAVAAGGPEDDVALGLHRDDDTEVTIVHTHADDGDTRALALAVRAVEAALARCTALELIESLQPPTAHHHD
jgi:hypothetical protein